MLEEPTVGGASAGADRDAYDSGGVFAGDTGVGDVEIP